MKTTVRVLILTLKEKYKKPSVLRLKTLIFAQQKIELNLKTKISNERFS